MESLISQGINLAVFGMGTVFVFLTLLIIATRFMSYLVNRFSIESSDSNRSPVLNSRPSEPSPHTIAIISAAIQEHRKLVSERHD